MSKSATRRKPARKAPAKPAAAAPAATPANRPSPLLWAGLGAVVVATIVATVMLWPRAPGADIGPPPPGGGPRVLAKVESLYNDITVYQQSDGLMTLAFGAKRLNYIESIVNPKDDLDLPVTYTQSMTAGLAYADKLERAAIIGLGGGRTAWYHHKSVPGMHFTAAELDPEVARLADKFFNVRPERNFDIQIQDGRVWLSKSDQSFDIILVDAYRGPFVPFHLLTSEFYKLVAAHLAPGGVVVQNVEPTTMLFDSAVATIRSAFEHLVFLRGAGNIVVLAYNGPLKDEATIQRLAAERTKEYGLRYDLTDILTRRYTPADDYVTKPLTDDFAPVEYLKAIERHNEKQTMKDDVAAARRKPPLWRRLAVGPGAAALVVVDVATLGFITLGFEMVASRILTPLFGSGIYTWATIISIVVAGLMAGYFSGGVLADRNPNFGVAAIIKFVAAAYLFFVFAITGGGLDSLLAAIPDDITALFVSGIIVCFPPLMVLGMYSPLSVRLVLKDPHDAGRVSGGLFAISSAGNIAGTIVTTFLLIPNVGTRAITLAFAAFLVISGVISVAIAATRPRD